MRIFYGFLCVRYMMLRGPVYDIEFDRGNIIGVTFVLWQLKFNVHILIR